MNLNTEIEMLEGVTLSKRNKAIIAIITKFNDDSRYAMQYAIDLFGTRARYVLLCIYSIENAPSEGSLFPVQIRSKMTKKLLKELTTIREQLGIKQPEILIEFEFGTKKRVIDSGWNEGRYDLIVMPSSILGWFSSIPTKQAPILTVPRKLV